MSPKNMKFAVEKVEKTGNPNVLITERGTQFGYGDLVVDFRGIPKMRTFAPIVMDITHSLQRPNNLAGVTGGFPQPIETMGRAAIAVGVDGLFIETHPDPLRARSDGPSMLPLDKMEALLERWGAIRQTIDLFPAIDSF